jgi:hypothetical protein
MAGISYVFTISRVAEMLGEDEGLLQEISIDMDPEDGRLAVLGPGEEATTAFTHDGVDNLTELVKLIFYSANSQAIECMWKSAPKKRLGTTFRMIS